MNCSIIGVAAAAGACAGEAVSIWISVSSFNVSSKKKSPVLIGDLQRLSVALIPNSPQKQTASGEETRSMASGSKPEHLGPSVSTQEALEFHAAGRPGKLEINPTKPMATQRDLSLAYSPGVAAPVLAIADDPSRAFDYTSRGNMVAVISNGSSLLGLGYLGALAS
jgi:hypothetical protein